MMKTVISLIPCRSARAVGASELSESGYAPVSTQARSDLLARSGCTNLVQTRIDGSKLYKACFVQPALILKTFLQVCLLMVVKVLLKHRRRNVSTSYVNAARTLLARAGFLGRAWRHARWDLKEGEGVGAGALWGGGAPGCPDGVPVPRGIFFDGRPPVFSSATPAPAAPPSRQDESGAPCRAAPIS
jgi:hypothetical protein